MFVFALGLPQLFLFVHYNTQIGIYQAVFVVLCGAISNIGKKYVENSNFTIDKLKTLVYNPEKCKFKENMDMNCQNDTCTYSLCPLSNSNLISYEPMEQAVTELFLWAPTSDERMPLSSDACNFLSAIGTSAAEFRRIVSACYYVTPGSCPKISFFYQTVL